MRTYVELVLADGSRLECRSMQGDEQLGTAAVFVVEVLSAAPLDTALVGTRALIALRGDREERLIPGAIWKLVSIMTASAEGPRRYRIELRSGFAWLQLRRRTRVYQNLSVPGIVRQVLQANGYEAGDIVERLGELHTARAYVTQYDETDAVFVRRICEDEGLYLRFEEADGRERFLLEDTSANAPRGTEDPLLVESRHGVEASQVVAYDFEDVRQRRVGRYTTRDYDPLRPALKLEGVAKVPDGQKAGPAQVFDARVAPDMAPQDDFIEVLLFDSAGQPIPSDLDSLAVQFEVTLANNTTLPPTPIANGYGAIPSIKGDPPSSCVITFDGFDDFSDTVPAEALTVAAPASSSLMSRRGAPVLDAQLLTRRELAGQAVAGALNSANVVRLRRRTVRVLECEHFMDGSALFLPIACPTDLLRPGVKPVLGLDVLRVCLQLLSEVPSSQALVAGHGSTLSRERAVLFNALLSADRDTWSSVAPGASSGTDVPLVMVWAFDTFSWDSDPTAANLTQAFQRRYSADLAAFAKLPGRSRTPIADDGILGPQTWGALFDCYLRALAPAPPAPSPNALPYINVRYGKNFVPFQVALDAGFPADRYTDMNRYNPSKPLTPADRGWRPTFPGERVLLPPTWDTVVDTLCAAGWDAHHGQAPPAVSTTTQQPLFLTAPGLRVVACGAHHLRSPDDGDEERRALERHVEVILFESEHEASATSCMADGPTPCVSAKCEIYDPREFVYDYVSLDGPVPLDLTPVVFRILLENGAPAAGVPATIRAPDYSLIQCVTDARGEVRLLGRGGETFALIAVQPTTAPTVIQVVERLMQTT